MLYKYEEKNIFEGDMTLLKEMIEFASVQLKRSVYLIMKGMKIIFLWMDFGFTSVDFSQGSSLDRLLPERKPEEEVTLLEAASHYLPPVISIC